MSYPLQLLIICPLLFLAGFGDAIAGGGGTISLPAFMLAGLPTHNALGTNKLVMCVGTMTSVYEYGKSGRIIWGTALCAGVGALAGASLGAKIALLINSEAMNYVLIVLLPAAFLFLVLRKSFGSGEFRPAPVTARRCALAAVSGACVGLYDGFFGPGAGTFYIMAFTAALGLSLPEASADAKVANLGSNLGALITFILNGVVIWKIALPGILFTVTGNYFGSRLAIKNGARFIRPIMAVMILLLLVKTVVSMF